MIDFTTLRITEQGDCLQVDCAVSEGEAYEKVFIQSVWLGHWTDWQPRHPGEHAVQVWPEKGSNEDESVREVSVDVRPWQLGKDFGTSKFSGEMFYVFVEWGGTPDMATLPCGEDDQFAIAIVLDWKAVHEEGMSLLKAVLPCAGGCADKSEFIDFILRWHALRLAIDTCDFDTANDLWGRLFGGGKKKVEAAGCGCGRA